MPSSLRGSFPQFDSAILLHITEGQTKADLFASRDWVAPLSDGTSTRRSGADLEYWLYRRLLHEAQHAAEIVQGKPMRTDTTDEASLARYVNSPSEVRAYARQITLEAAEHLSRTRDVGAAVSRSYTWELIQGYLTEKNKRRIMRYVWSELS